MAVFKEFKVTVRGRSPFPLDMLRYDRAYPHTEKDSGELRRATETWSREDVTVVLVSKTDPRKPTGHRSEGRWNSFGWHVLDVEGIK